MTKVLTINGTETNKKTDKIKMKSRAIISNDEGKILIANYAGVYLFPGGSIDEGESPKDAIIRELKEEAGMEVNKIRPLAKLKYFQDDYPTRDGSTINRLLITYYYLVKGKIVNQDRNLSEKEKNGGFELKFYSISEIEKALEDNQTQNPRNSYFNTEIRTILDYYKRENTKNIENGEFEL